MERGSRPDTAEAGRFVSERIEPVSHTIGSAGVIRGEPGLPEVFRWRGKEYAVARVLESWKDTSACKHGGGEQYVRKHWFRFDTADGCEMTVYFERQAASRRERKHRWWLYTMRGTRTQK